MVEEDGDRDIISQEEREAIILALGEGRGDKGFSEEEALKAIAWAEDITISYALLQNVIGGLVSMDISEEGEFLFGITRSGISEVEHSYQEHVSTRQQTDKLQ